VTDRQSVDAPGRRAARVRSVVTGLLLLIYLGGCASRPAGHDESTRVLLEAVSKSQERLEPAAIAPAEPADRAAGAAAQPQPQPQVFPGTGSFINEAAVAADSPAPPIESVALNFENADIREVVRVILGETLNESYVIDPQAMGQITLRTSQPMDRAGLLLLLETVLQANGLVLIRADGLYRIALAAGAMQRSGGVSIGGRPIRAGYQARVVQLRFIAAEEMAKILQPLLSAQNAIRVDEERNLLILAGSSIELAQAEQLIGMFDVDRFRGMSTALFPLRYVDAGTIAGELRNILAGEGAQGVNAVLRLMPVERLNALLVVTPQRGYLELVETWLGRLDTPGGVSGRQLYVYRVENVRATELAGILQQLFSKDGKSDAPRPPELAPGAAPRIIRTSPDQSDADIERAIDAVGVIEQPGSSGEASGSARASIAEQDAAPAGDVSIIADPSSNALVILAAATDYAKIESAIRRLDVMPLQVLLETTIVEVSLSGELSYGMQWFFDDNFSDRRRGAGTVGLPLSFPGSFSYSIVNAADELRAMFRVLATEDRIQVVSSPSVVVLDNQTANIRVGNQQPVSTAIVAEGGIVSTSVQFKDTGVTLDVTPRVNAGGLVTLDISQELTDVGQIDDATGQRAFLQRSVRSSVALQSGESIVLGGLIRNNEIDSSSGVPFLHKVPLIGALFGQKINTQDRTELLVFIHATVIENSAQAQGVLDEFRRKMPEVFAVPMRIGDADSNPNGNEGSNTP
jgi:general secretion pathway protein D